MKPVISRDKLKDFKSKVTLDSEEEAAPAENNDQEQ